MPTIHKTMKGWKVIKKDTRLSARASNWNDEIGKDFEKWVLHYPPNVSVEPKVKGSKIMFFKNKTDAISFYGLGETIVPCIATNAEKMKFSVSNILYVESFWESLMKGETYWAKEAIKGTYGADSIICLE